MPKNPGTKTTASINSPVTGVMQDMNMPMLTDEQFTEALNTEDDLGMVVRTHIHLEHWVELYLSSVLPKWTNYSKALFMDYEKKVLLSAACGIDEELIKPLKGIGSLRNNFAHKPNYHLKKPDLDNLYNTISGNQKIEIQNTYRILAKRFGREEKEFKDLSNKLKLSIIFMYLRVKVRMAS